MSVTVRAFAKINLGLSIGPVRPDGFHELLTVYQTIGLHDLLRVSAGRGTGIEIRCDDERVPRDESNTCWRIAEKTMAALKARGRVKIEIEKRLPVQGGLGGASANAVAVMLGLERALKKSLHGEERLRIAADVGSDLPLFLIGGTVLGVGRGERVFPLPDLPATACVVVTPEVGVSTPKAFAEWDRVQAGLRPAGQPRAAVPTRDVPTRDIPTRDVPTRDVPTRAETASAELTPVGPSDRMNELGRALSAWSSELASASAPRKGGQTLNPLHGLVRAGIANDFEQVVFPEYPELREGKQALERAGAKYASLSGSGSALYGLFASSVAARAAAEKLRRQGWKALATATVTRRAYWRRVAG
jgi:4-diphosphocytidyl-2-C-methyl-D-erythritol kinase